MDSKQKAIVAVVVIVLAVGVIAKVAGGQKEAPAPVAGQVMSTDQMLQGQQRAQQEGRSSGAAGQGTAQQRGMAEAQKRGRMGGPPQAP